MRYRFIGALLILAVVVPLGGAAAAPAGNPGADATAAARRAAATWTRTATRTLAGAQLQPSGGSAFILDAQALRSTLAAAPLESTAQAQDAPLAVAIPTPDGEFETFEIIQSPVMEAGLAAAHPQIRTYAGRGIEDRTATVRMSVTPLGFHASVLSSRRAWYVDPQYPGDARRHIVYDRAALAPPTTPHIKRAPLSQDGSTSPAVADEFTASDASQVPLRTYRLALITDPTYAINSGARAGLDPQAPDYAEQLNLRVTAAKVVLMNRVNQIYEADMGIRMLLVDATDRTNLNAAAQATGANGPCGAEACFTTSQVSSCSSGGLNRNNTVAGLLVGARNFDIAHLGLGVNGGGIAQLGVVGDENKGRGCTGLPKPIGDFFAVDYVAHEMGHQFGAHHTFDGTQGSCAATNRNVTGETAIEPGSGTTVMAYAGICAQDDLQAHSDPYFSYASVSQIRTYTAVETTRSSTQQIALTGFDGTDSFTLGYGAQRTGAITRGSTYNAAAIKSALDAILPAGGSVTVTTPTDAGFAVTFGGNLASRPVEMLDIAVSGASGFVGEITAGGPTKRRGTPLPSENHPPSVTTAPPFTIPVQTPFTLTAQGTDPDGDTLTYLWEQSDPGPAAVGSSIFQPVRPVGPLFRVFGTAARYSDPNHTYLSPSPGMNLAGTDPSRTFPDMAQVLADNTNAQTGVCPVTGAPNPSAPSDAEVDCWSEFLPTNAWLGTAADNALHFRVTVRDNYPGAGGSTYADTALSLARGAGPFRVLNVPAAVPRDAGTLPVLWDVARTDVLTNTPTVRILLSTDGGTTFPHVLAASTANDGNQIVTLPAGVSTTKGRIKVEAIGNVFFDVSHTDLTIQS